MPNQSMTVSPSSLRLYDDCQRCFWRYVHLHEHRPEPHFPSLASGMDARIKEYFDYHRAQKTRPHEIAGTNTTLYPDMAKLAEWRDAKRGMRWQAPSGDTVMGALDDLLECNGKLVVMDYKTKGWPVRQGDSQRYQTQLDVYTMLLQKLGNPTEDHGYLLYYVPKEVMSCGDVLFDVSLHHVPVDPARAEKKCLDAITLLRGPMPASAAQCMYCSWAKKQ